MRWYLHKLAMMFGAEPRRPSVQEDTEAVREMRKFKKTPTRSRSARR